MQVRFMIFPRFRSGLALLAAFVASAIGSEPPSLPNDGPGLAAQLRSTPPPEDVEVSGMMRIRRDDGRRITRPIRYRVITGEEQWRQVFETGTAAGQPPQILVIDHHIHEPPVYTLMRNAHGAARASESITLTGDQAMVPFAGSDFWLADLGLDFLHWPVQRIDRETRLTMRKGRSCRVLESVNPQAGASGYVRVRSWVDIKTGGIIIAEAYGNDNRVAKEFEIGGFTKVDGRWALKSMEIRNIRSDSRTVFEFHYEVNP